MLIRLGVRVAVVMAVVASVLFGSAFVYVQVRDLGASLARAVELGGAQLTEPFDLPGGPTLAAISDPEGNALMLVQQ